MSEKKGFWRGLLEWAEHAHFFYFLTEIEFVKTLLFPSVMSIFTGVAGYFGRVPMMYIIVAVLLAFMASAQGILSASTYIERKNPKDKIQILRTLFNYDLSPISPPNRKQRRGATAQGGVPAVPAFRYITKGQLGVEIWNKASFPISIILESAETKIDELTPPRTKNAKTPTIIHPGTTMWIHDASIVMDDTVCGDFEGEINFILKYGVEGREVFKMTHRGTVEIFMEPFGLLKNIYFHPLSDD